MNILILIGNDNKDFYFELASIYNFIKNKSSNVQLFGVAINMEIENDENIFDFLINVKNKKINNMDFSAVSKILKEIIIKYNINLVLIHGTDYGRNLAPRLSAKLNVGLVADVTSVDYKNNVLYMNRPTYGGKLMASIICPDDNIKIMSIRPNMFKYENHIKKNTIYINYFPENILNENIFLLSTEKYEELSNNLNEAKIIVSGGNGINGKFDVLEKLAKELNGKVSGSRGAVDKNFISKQFQVGQSGNIVSPNLYFACGISGAIQHIVGMKNSNYVISININELEPISSVSDIVVKSDAIDFILKLTNKIIENK